MAFTFILQHCLKRQATATQSEESLFGLVRLQGSPVQLTTMIHMLVQKKEIKETET